MRRRPAEWQPQAGTWLVWPDNPAEWPVPIDQVRLTTLRIAAELSTGQCVWLIADPDADVPLERIDPLGGDRSAVRLVHLPVDDVWVRDTGPTFVRDGAGWLALDWRFDGWGGKFPHDRDDRLASRIADLCGIERRRIDFTLEGGAIDTNGRELLVTRSCLLDPVRNAGATVDDVETMLRRELGIAETVWLAGGLVGDDTDGHVDTVARFVADRTVVVAVADRGSADRRTTYRNWETLAAVRQAAHCGWSLVPLPVPDSPHAASHANFTIANDKVLVPTFGVPTDAEALAILADCFPDRRVVGIDCTALVTGSGALHCITLEHPAGCPMPFPPEPQASPPARSG